MFQVGQLVVCVKVDHAPSTLVLGRVYTVTQCRICTCGYCNNALGVSVAEAKAEDGYDGYEATHFRPITDERLAIFRSLLEPDPLVELEEAMRERADELDAVWNGALGG